MARVQLSNEKKKFYEELGFDSSLKGCVYFSDLVDDVRKLLDLNENIQFQDIEKIIPSLELEAYHFYFEVGKKEYDKEIDCFLKSSSDFNDKYFEVFGSKDIMTKNEYIYKTAEFLNKNRDLQNSHVKTFVKDNDLFSKA